MDSSFDAGAYFRDFYARFDTALMGRKTYEVVKGPFEGMATYMFSRTLSPADHPGVTVVADDGIDKVRELRGEDGKDIWLFGGGELFGSLAAAGLVDKVELGVMPVLLGEGKFRARSVRRSLAQILECADRIERYIRDDETTNRRSRTTR
jgi:dihydrofolate reductase